MYTSLHSRIGQQPEPLAPELCIRRIRARKELQLVSRVSVNVRFAYHARGISWLHTDVDMIHVVSLKFSPVVAAVLIVSLRRTTSRRLPQPCGPEILPHLPMLLRDVWTCWTSPTAFGFVTGPVPISTPLIALMSRARRAPWFPRSPGR